MLDDTQLAAKGIDRIPLPLDGNPFDDARDDRAEYCNVCDDYLPNMDTCKHLQDVADGNGMAGCGSNDRDAQSHKASTCRLLALLPHDVLCRYARALKDGESRTVDFDGHFAIEAVECKFGIDNTLTVEFDFEVDAEVGVYALGIAWIRSLHTGKTPSTTPDADAITLAWAEAVLAERVAQFAGRIVSREEALAGLGDPTTWEVDNATQEAAMRKPYSDS